MRPAARPVSLSLASRALLPAAVPGLSAGRVQQKAGCQNPVWGAPFVAGPPVRVAEVPDRAASPAALLGLSAGCARGQAGCPNQVLGLPPFAAEAPDRAGCRRC